MHIAAEAVFWFALTMLGLVAVTYALAQSQAGRVRNRIELEKRLRQNELDAERRRVKQELVGEEQPDGRSVSKAGQDLIERERDILQERRRLDRLPSIVDAQESVVKPGAYLLASFVLATIGRVISDPGLENALPGGWATLTVAAAMVLSIKGVRSLIQRLLDLQSFSELLVPEVNTKVGCATIWPAGQAQRVRVTVTLSKGVSLHTMHIALYVPPELEPKYCNTNLTFPKDAAKMPGYRTCLSKCWPTLLREIPWHWDFHPIKGNDPGEYTLYYRVFTEEYLSDEIPVKVIVD